MREPRERNIYAQARDAAGLTQQRWAECLGVSVQAVRGYESGDIMPAEDIVLSMADLSGLQILGTWHLRRKSAVAAEILPEVERLPLAQAVVQLLAQIQIFQSRHHADALLTIAADGVVDAKEQGRFEEILRDLRPLRAAAMQIEYADRGRSE